MDYSEFIKFSKKDSYFYVEYAHICVKNYVLTIIKKEGQIPIPCGVISTIFIGLGTSITNNAIRHSIKRGCLLIFVGENLSKCYSYIADPDRRASNFLKQIDLYFKFRKKQALYLFEKRFGHRKVKNLDLETIRGHEGALIKKYYKNYAKEYGISWMGRKTKTEWENNDNFNRALSVANSCLYGIVNSAIISLGYSSALGLIHTGNHMSLVYDIADLYKLNYTVKLAFELHNKKDNFEISIESLSRNKMKELFEKEYFMDKVINDIQDIMDECHYH